MINSCISRRIKVFSIIFLLFIILNILLNPFICEAHPILPGDIQNIIQSNSSNVSNPTGISIDPGINIYRKIPIEETQEDQAKNGLGFIRTALTFIKLGILHIFTGYDHILFLLAFLLTFISIRNVVKLVTTFTVAHSITLILSGTKFLTLSSRIVEPIIAFSISYVAVSTVLLRNKRSHDSQIHKIIVIFIFGLFHGLGFAGVLKEVQIPQDKFILSLLFFNAGVEIGQLAIIALIIPIIIIISKRQYSLRVTKITAIIISIIGVCLAIFRIFRPNII